MIMQPVQGVPHAGVAFCELRRGVGVGELTTSCSVVKSKQFLKRCLMEIRTYERQKLYKEVWAEPMTTVAKRYGISDVALRKQCKKLEMPLPGNDHWAKVKAGQKIKIPLLPKSKGPDEIVTQSSVRESSSSPALKRSDILLFLTENQRQVVKEYCSLVAVPAELTHPHGLIKDTIQYLRSRKESTKPPVNRVLNLGVSDEQKERVYRIYSTLFIALENLGYSIEIKYPKAQYYRNYEPRVFDNVTYICMGQDGVSISIKEKQQRVEHQPTKEELEKEKRYSYAQIPRYDLLKTGKLHFDIDEHHSKRKHWHDSDTRKIEDQIGGIIIWVMDAIYVVKTSREQHEAEEIVRAEVEQRLRHLQELRKTELEQVELLEQAASAWKKAQKIREFANSAESKISEIKNEEKRVKIINWLKWVRDKADWLDPLTEKEDDRLGISQHIFDSIDYED